MTGTAAETPLLNRSSTKTPGMLAGVLVAFLSVALVTALIYPVRSVAPAVSAGVIYLLAVLLVSTIWGLRLGILTALLSALAFNWFHIPPTGRLTIGLAENWVALGVFLVTAIVVSTISELARSRAAQAERRQREADLAFELAQMFSASPVPEACDRASVRIAEALELDRVQISLGHFATEGPRLRLMRSDRVPVAALRYDGKLDEDTTRTLEAAVLPALEALIAAGLERDALSQSLVEKEALKRSDELKTSLLRAVSHDLRTPLTAIAAAGEALQSPTIDPKDRAELAATITEEAERLSSLVSKLLDLSRLQAGEVKPRRDWCALEELVQTAADQSEAPALVELNVDGDVPLVRADGAMLERAFANLIENALRHGGGMPVSVSIRGTGSHARIRVIDRGPGIDPDDLESIFEAFKRGDTQAGGAGLGLAIVKGMVEMNGGTVWAESLPGQGATFVIDLPVEPVPAATGARVDG